MQVFWDSRRIFGGVYLLLARQELIFNSNPFRRHFKVNGVVCTSSGLYSRSSRIKEDMIFRFCVNYCKQKMT